MFSVNHTDLMNKKFSSFNEFLIFLKGTIYRFRLSLYGTADAPFNNTSGTSDEIYIACFFFQINNLKHPCLFSTFPWV